VVPGTTPHTAQQKMQAKVEALICQQADTAIWFTNQALASALQRNPVLGARGRVMLPGVDAPTRRLQAYQRGETLVIGHFGSLSPTRNLVTVMQALDRLLEQQAEWRGRVVLQLTGGPLDADSARALAAMRHPCVQHLGRVESDPVSGLSGRDQILQRMRQADVLLLLHGIEPICAEYIPSKMYEYLWMQRPILAQVHCNPQMGQILSDMGHQVLQTEPDVPWEDPLTEALRGLILAWLTTGLPDNGLDSPYTTGAAVAQLCTMAQVG
jgi:glycosyltransferase involved in cell wall biosynthesis